MQKGCYRYSEPDTVESPPEVTRVDENYLGRLRVTLNLI